MSEESGRSHDHRKGKSCPECARRLAIALGLPADDYDESWRP